METTFATPELIQQVRDLIAAGDFVALRALLADVHPADVADLLEYLTIEEALAAFQLLPDYEAAEVLDEANSSLTARLIENVDQERLADLLDVLPMDDAAELLEDLPEATSEKLLGLMEPEESRDVREILSYPDESAGRIMTQDVAALRANWTVTQALNYLRALPDTETLHYLYVVDVVGHLIGVVPIRNLILAQAETLIEVITVPSVVAVNVSSDQEDIADVISRYDYTAVPVVDDEGVLVGVITVDDVLDVLEEEATEDIQQLGGSSPLEQPYFNVSVWTMVRKRVGWLIMLFAASMLSSSVLDRFQSLTATFVVLTIFIPLIIGTGGNAGSQTVATIIRAIAVEEVRLNDLWRALLREITVGLLMGIVLGAVGLLYAYLRADENAFEVALVVALTLPAVVIWSNIAATIIPIMAERLNIDPTVVSAPMITTIVDSTGLLIYFSLAYLILL